MLDLDLFVRETARVLRPGGRAIVCTKNLSSWHNIAALVLGLMPFSLIDIFSRGAIGNPFSLASTPAAELETSWFHTRVLTAVGLEHLFRVHDLDVVARFATGYHPLPTRLARVAARRRCTSRGLHRRHRREGRGLNVSKKPRRTPTP